MHTLKLSKRSLAELISQVNYMFSANRVDAMDRTPVAELAFAELIAATLPTVAEGQAAADFYRTTLLDTVRAFVDDLVEVVQINHEQCLLAVWSAYNYRMSMVNPQFPSHARPCLERYVAMLPPRHGELVVKYPNLCNEYGAIASFIYA